MKYDSGLWIWGVFCHVSCHKQESCRFWGPRHAVPVTRWSSGAHGKHRLEHWSPSLVIPRPRVSHCEQPASCLRRAIGRRITSSPPRDRSHTRWRISGGWCGSGSATPSLCLQKFRRGSRYVSYSGWLQSRAANVGKIWALMLNYLLSDRRLFFFALPTAGTCFAIWCGPVVPLVRELSENPPKLLKIMVCKRAQFSLKAQNL